jgi:hypothetical protein
MSRFGIMMVVVVVLSAGLAAQTTGAQQQGQSDAKSTQTVPPIPWLDPSLADAPDRATTLAIAVATRRDCSANSTAICYGFCAPRPDQRNQEQPTSRESAPIKEQNPATGKLPQP